MKTRTIIMLLVMFTIAVAQKAMAQSLAHELARREVQEFRAASLDDKIRCYPIFYNLDGTHRVYVVDTLSADRVETILKDRGLNMYAIIDTTALLSENVDDIVNSKYVYLYEWVYLTFSELALWEPFNAFCDSYYFWDTLSIVANPDGGPPFQHFYQRSDYVNETYYQYFDKHARKYGKQRYLEYPILYKPLYYMIFMMEGAAYNELENLYKDNYGSEPFYIPIKFRDPSAYYRVLVPVYVELDGFRLQQ